MRFFVQKMSVILFFFALLIPLAMGQKYSASWHCPQTERALVPIKDDISFSFDGDIVISSDFDDLLSKASLRHDYDYFNCFNDFIGRVLAHEGPSLKDKRNALFYFKRKSYLYGREVFMDGGLTPVAPGQKSDPPLDAAALEQVEKGLTSLCQTYSDAPNKLSTDFRLLDKSFVDNKLGDFLDKSDDRCKQKTVKRYLEAIRDSAMGPSQCLDHSVKCEKRKKEIDLFLARLQEFPVFNNLLEPINYQQARCMPENDFLNSSLKNMIEVLEIAPSCVILNEGESKDVYNNGSGIGEAYTLERKKDKHGKKNFEITLNMNFIQEGEYFNPSFHNNTKGDFESCIQEHKDKLRGPSGEFLDIKIKDGYQSQKVKLTHDITIMNNNRRSNSLEWSPDIDCATKIHELMHLLGLVDEYHEQENGCVLDEQGDIRFVTKGATAPSYDCRVIGPIDSVMANPHHAILSAKEKTEILNCVCDENALAPDEEEREEHNLALPSMFNESEGITSDDSNRIANLSNGERIFSPEMLNTCQQILSHARPELDSCPAGTSSLSFSLNSKNENYKESVENAKKYLFNPEYASRIISVSKKRKLSILLPAHFRLITEPDCKTRNKKYLSCSRFAYQTSRANYGEERCEVKKPDYCKTGDHSWTQ